MLSENDLLVKTSNDSVYLKFHNFIKEFIWCDISKVVVERLEGNTKEIR